MPAVVLVLRLASAVAAATSTPARQQADEQDGRQGQQHDSSWPSTPAMPLEVTLRLACTTSIEAVLQQLARVLRLTPSEVDHLLCTVHGGQVMALTDVLRLLVQYTAAPGGEGDSAPAKEDPETAERDLAAQLGPSFQPAGPAGPQARVVLSIDLPAALQQPVTQAAAPQQHMGRGPEAATVNGWHRSVAAAARTSSWQQAEARHQDQQFPADMQQVHSGQRRRRGAKAADTGRRPGSPGTRSRSASVTNNDRDAGSSGGTYSSGNSGNEPHSGCQQHQTCSEHQTTSSGQCPPTQRLSPHLSHHPLSKSPSGSITSGPNLLVAPIRAQAVQAKAARTGQVRPSRSPAPVHLSSQSPKTRVQGNGPASMNGIGSNGQTGEGSMHRYPSSYHQWGPGMGPEARAEDLVLSAAASAGSALAAESAPPLWGTVTSAVQGLTSRHQSPNAHPVASQRPAAPPVERNANGTRCSPAMSKFKATRLVTGTEPIPQSVFVSTICQPGVPAREVSEFFVFHRPVRPPRSNASTRVNLTNKQHDVLYALAGCTDVMYTTSKISKQTRFALAEHYGIDKTSLSTWFKNRRLEPKKALSCPPGRDVAADSGTSGPNSAAGSYEVAARLQEAMPLSAPFVVESGAGLAGQPAAGSTAAWRPHGPAAMHPQHPGVGVPLELALQHGAYPSWRHQPQPPLHQQRPLHPHQYPPYHPMQQQQLGLQAAGSRAHPGSMHTLAAWYKDTAPVPRRRSSETGEPAPSSSPTVWAHHRSSETGEPVPSPTAAWAQRRSSETGDLGGLEGPSPALGPGPAWAQRRRSETGEQDGAPGWAGHRRHSACSSFDTALASPPAQNMYWQQQQQQQQQRQQQQEAAGWMPSSRGHARAHGEGDLVHPSRADPRSCAPGVSVRRPGASSQLHRDLPGDQDQIYYETSTGHGDQSPKAGHGHAIGRGARQDSGPPSRRPPVAPLSIPPSHGLGRVERIPETVPTAARGEPLESAFTRLLGARDPITQSVFCIIIRSPGVAGNCLSQHFELPSMKLSGTGSPHVQLSHQQCQALLALAGCSDVAFTLGNVQAQARAAMADVYGISDQALSQWFVQHGRGTAAGSKRSSMSSDDERARKSPRMSPHYDEEKQEGEGHKRRRSQQQQQQQQQYRQGGWLLDSLRREQEEARDWAACQQGLQQQQQQQQAQPHHHAPHNSSRWLPRHSQPVSGPSQHAQHAQRPTEQPGPAHLADAGSGRPMDEDVEGQAAQAAQPYRQQLLQQLVRLQEQGGGERDERGMMEDAEMLPEPPQPRAQQRSEWRRQRQPRPQLNELQHPDDDRDHEQPIPPQQQQQQRHQRQHMERQSYLPLDSQPGPVRPVPLKPPGAASQRPQPYALHEVDTLDRQGADYSMQAYFGQQPFTLPDALPHPAMGPHLGPEEHGNDASVICLPHGVVGGPSTPVVLVLGPPIRHTDPGRSAPFSAAPYLHPLQQEGEDAACPGMVAGHLPLMPLAAGAGHGRQAAGAPRMHSHGMGAVAAFPPGGRTLSREAQQLLPPQEIVQEEDEEAALGASAPAPAPASSMLRLGAEVAELEGDPRLEGAHCVITRVGSDKDDLAACAGGAKRAAAGKGAAAGVNGGEPKALTQAEEEEAASALLVMSGAAKPVK